MDLFRRTFYESLNLSEASRDRSERVVGFFLPIRNFFSQVFFRREEDKQLYFRLLSHSAPYSRRILWAILFMAGTGLFDAGPIALLQPILDEIFTQRNREMLSVLPVALVVLFGMKGICNFAQKYLMRMVAQKVMRDLRYKVFSRVLVLPHSFFSSKRTGEIISRLTNDIQIIDKGVSTVISDLFKDVFTIISLILVILILDWRFALVSLVSIPLLVAPIGFLAQILRRASKISQEMLGTLTSIIQESTTGISIIKAFRGERYTEQRFQDANEKYYFQARTAIKAAASSTPITEFIGACLAAGVIYYGGAYVIDGVFSSGTFIACLAALFKMYMPFKQLGNISHAIQQSVVAAERVFDILDTPGAIEENPEAEDLPPMRESIAFNDVSFSYAEGQNVLCHIDLKVKKGESIAFVGASGAGKTTLLHLIPRFFDPSEGIVAIDGVDIRKVTVSSLRRQIGMVSQDVILFNDTIAENIAYGLEASEIDMERVKNAARMANAEEFILNMADGYNTVVGERGMSLSGGQRQRLSLARALYHDPSILLLDEATSALDPESERLVQDAIKTLMSNRTTFIIAHRLSTIRNVDRIVVLGAGQIVEVGTHEQLLRPGTLYKRYHDMQFG